MREESNLKLDVLRSSLFGILLAFGPLAILAHGALNAGSIATGLIMTVPTALLIALGDWNSFRPNWRDALFALFVTCVAASIASNGIGDDPKELYLLILCLAAYPAARLSGSSLFGPGLVVVAAATVLAGTVVTLSALVAQWSAPHGKPLVFGQFNAAPAQFAMLLGFLLLAFATSDRLTVRRTVLVAILVALPVAIFAASMVRFTLLAFTASLAVAALLSPTRQSRRLIAALLCATVTFALVGLVARWQTTESFATRIASALDLAPVRADARMLLPDGRAVNCPPIDIDNSIAIRKQLYVDAIAALPSAGLLGIGLDRFSTIACVKGLSPHNAFLQAVLEFGWPAGLALVLLLIAAIRVGITPLVEISSEFRFATCGLLYVAALASAHGRISREMALFLFLGYAAALGNAKFEIAKNWLLRRPSTMPSAEVAH